MRTLTCEKSARNFADMKTVATFAVSYIFKGRRKPANTYIAGIFHAYTFAAIIPLKYSGCLIPCGDVNALPTAFEVCKTAGHEQPLFCSIMPKSSLIMANLVLSKESSESEIKRYFNAVLELSKSDNEYPVNLDEVWMLVYGKKSDAVESLKKDFIENIDYQILRQNPQKSKRGRPSFEYLLSIPCMEFFIARKVRPVFEVYRQTFHFTVSTPKDCSHINPSDYTREDLADLIIESEEDLQAQDKIIAGQKERIKELEEKLEHERQRKIDARFERIESAIGKMAELMASPLQTASVPSEAVETDMEDANVEVQPMLVHEMRTRIKEEYGLIIPYKKMFSLLAGMGWCIRNEKYNNRPGSVAVRKGYVLESGSDGRKGEKQFYVMRITEKGYRKFVEEVIGKGGLL